MTASTATLRLGAAMRHPYVTLATGLALAGTSLIELLEVSESLTSSLHAEHGILLFGIVQIVRSLAEILEHASHFVPHMKPGRSHAE